MRENVFLFDPYVVENTFYESLKRQEVQFNEDWIWSIGSAGQCKSSISILWLCWLHKSDRTLGIVGISLRVDMEKVNMMV